jgi:chromosome segregation ATPase
MKKFFQTAKFLYDGTASDEICALKAQIREYELRIQTSRNALAAMNKAVLGRLEEIQYIARELKDLQAVLMSNLNILEEAEEDITQLFD